MKKILQTLALHEVYFVSRRLKPILHLIERLTGITSFALSSWFSFLGLVTVYISGIPVLIETGGIMNNPFLAPLCMILLLFEGFYLKMIWETAQIRRILYLSNELQTVRETGVVHERMKRLVLLVLSTTTCFAVAECLKRSLYLPAFLLLPLTFTYPAFLCCGVVPYFKPSAQEQSIRSRKSIRTTVFFTLLFVWWMITTARHSSNEEKLLLGSALSAILVFVIKITQSSGSR